MARIAPGAIFTSAPVQMPVPASTPDNPRLRVDIADIYHHYGWDDELIMRGVGGSRQAAIVETPYSGRIDTVSPAVSTGDQDVVITGRAVSTADGTPVPDAALNLIITLDGFERNIAVTTDTDGAFSHTFTPRPTQSTFTVSKIDIQPSKIRAYNGDILCFYAFRHKSGTLRDVIDILVSPVNAYPGGGLEDF